MKIAIIIICALSIHQQFIECFQELTQEILDCITELKIEKSKIAFPVDSNYLSEDISEINNVMGCFWKKKGYLNSSGAINYKSLIQFFKTIPKRFFGNVSDAGNVGYQIASDAVDGCKNITRGNTIGQTVVRTSNCITRFIEEFVEEEEM